MALTQQRFQTDVDFDMNDEINHQQNLQKMKKTIQNLITICEKYTKNCGFFDSEALPAKHIIKQFKHLNQCMHYIPEDHRFSFQQVMLHSYILAVLKNIPVQSRLSCQIQDLVTDLTLKNPFIIEPIANTKKNYCEQIKQVINYFSSSDFRDCSKYATHGGTAIFYARYEELNGRPGLINKDVSINHGSDDEEEGIHLTY